MAYSTKYEKLVSAEKPNHIAGSALPHSETTITVLDDVHQKN